MQVLFVHGMGRSPVSGWPMLWKLRAAGLMTGTFGYRVSVEDFRSIRSRLLSCLASLAGRGDYVLIGHSLGGVLLRSAVNTLPPETRPPVHLFLLGSPQRPSLLARQLQSNRLFRMLTGDCGQLLSSSDRMNSIGHVAVPVTNVIGTQEFPVTRGAFNGEPNDGVVSLSEVHAERIADQVAIPVVHTLLPSSPRVAEIVLARIALYGTPSNL
jgi:hypothetical protein